MQVQIKNKSSKSKSESSTFKSKSKSMSAENGLESNLCPRPGLESYKSANSAQVNAL